MSGALGEFFGTMILILLGDGVVAGVLLKRSKGENAGWVAKEKKNEKVNYTWSRTFP